MNKSEQKWENLVVIGWILFLVILMAAITWTMIIPIIESEWQRGIEYSSSTITAQMADISLSF